MTSLEVGLLCLGKATAALALGVQRRLGVEKGYPKTASPTPTRAATDNTLLSEMGGGTMVPQKGWWGAGQENAGQRASFTTPATSSSALGPPQSRGLRACPRTGRPTAPASRVQLCPPPPTLLCVGSTSLGSTSLSSLFSRLLKATSDKHLLLQAVALKRLHLPAAPRARPWHWFFSDKALGRREKARDARPALSPAHTPRAELPQRRRPSPAAVPAPQLGPGLPYLRLHPTARKARAPHGNLGSSFACHFLPKIPLNSRFP